MLGRSTERRGFWIRLKLFVFRATYECQWQELDQGRARTAAGGGTVRYRREQETSVVREMFSKFMN